MRGMEQTRRRFLEWPSKNGGFMVDFLVKTLNPISPQVARGFLCFLQQGLSLQNAGVRVRNDSWFIDLGLPYLCPFESNPTRLRATNTCAPLTLRAFQARMI